MSTRKSTDEEIESLPTIEDSHFAPSYLMFRSDFVKGRISLCLELMKDCSTKARALLIMHLAGVVEGYDSEDTFKHILASTQLTWCRLYRTQLGRWLRDEAMPLDCCLRVIFTLLKYVPGKDEVQMVYTDLSGVRLTFNIF